MACAEADFSRPALVQDASPGTLHRLVERLRSSSSQHLPARLKELEEFLARMDDDLLKAYDQARGSQVKTLIERRRWVFTALDALAQGQKEQAQKALERALRPRP